MSDSLIDRIVNARVYDVARETALERAPRLSARLESRIWLKREDLQSIFSFKLRGAYNKIALLPPELAAHGVIAASAGNHAQGVALAARQRGIRARIVMPVTTPPIKVEAVKALDAEVVLHGDTYDDAHELARVQAEQEGFVYVHAYDQVCAYDHGGVNAIWEHHHLDDDNRVRKCGRTVRKKRPCSRRCARNDPPLRWT